jgi:hypothetical protein
MGVRHRLAWIFYKNFIIGADFSPHRAPAAEFGAVCPQNFQKRMGDANRTPSDF